MTDSIRNVANKQPVVLDPNFFLPPGVVDVRHVNDNETDGLYPDDVEETAVEGEDVTAPEDAPIDITSDVLQPPASITIVSQTVKVANDGKFAVDVVIEVEDLPGVNTYETRLTKV
jgi:hypothetical protein